MRLLRRTVAIASLLMAAAPWSAQAAGPLDEPGTVLTVMQFTAKSPAARPELKLRMAAIRDFLRQQPGLVENALLENLSPDAKPQFVGVSRWTNARQWEVLWQKPEFQNLVRAVNEVGDVTPGAFTAVK